jgi:hypothetical protein
MPKYYGYWEHPAIDWYDDEERPAACFPACPPFCFPVASPGYTPGCNPSAQYVCAPFYPSGKIGRRPRNKRCLVTSATLARLK